MNKLGRRHILLGIKRTYTARTRQHLDQKALLAACMHSAWSIWFHCIDRSALLTYEWIGYLVVGCTWRAWALGASHTYVRARATDPANHHAQNIIHRIITN